MFPAEGVKTNLESPKHVENETINLNRAKKLNLGIKLYVNPSVVHIQIQR